MLTCKAETQASWDSIINYQVATHSGQTKRRIFSLEVPSLWLTKLKCFMEELMVSEKPIELLIFLGDFGELYQGLEDRSYTPLNLAVN